MGTSRCVQSEVPFRKTERWSFPPEWREVASQVKLRGVNRFLVLLLAVVVIGGTGWAWSTWEGEVAKRGDASAAMPSPMSTETEAAPPNGLSRDGKPLRVVFAGDSLTYGLYASSEDRGYRALTVAALEEAGPVKWSRGGQVGNRVATVAETIDYPKSTDLVVLALGTNDAYETDPDDLRTQYEALAATARRSARDAVIICMGVWGNIDASRNWDPPIQDGCESVGGTFVPLTDLFEDASNRGPAGREAFGGTSDDFHPNDKGYAAIAQRLLDTIGAG